MHSGPTAVELQNQKQTRKQQQLTVDLSDVREGCRRFARFAPYTVCISLLVAANYGVSLFLFLARPSQAAWAVPVYDGGLMSFVSLAEVWTALFVVGGHLWRCRHAAATLPNRVVPLLFACMGTSSVLLVISTFTILLWVANDLADFIDSLYGPPDDATLYALTAVLLSLLPLQLLLIYLVVKLLIIMLNLVARELRVRAAMWCAWRLHLIHDHRDLMHDRHCTPPIRRIFCPTPPSHWHSYCEDRGTLGVGDFLGAPQGHCGPGAQPHEH